MADTYETINCPACGKKMLKIFVKECGINVDICKDGCGGIFFDNRELKYFDEQHELVDETIRQMEAQDYPPVDETVDRFCPTCGAKMVKNNTSATGSIQIDECYTCGAKFLEHGELTRMRAEFATEKQRSADAIKYLYSQIGQELAGDMSVTKSNISYRRGMAGFISKLLGL